MTLEQKFESGLSKHRAGRLVESEQIHREVLRQQLARAEALHLLGMVAPQSRRLDAAAQLIEQAISVCPTSPFYRGNLGEVLEGLGRLSEAVECYRHGIQLNPNLAELHNNLGKVLKETGQFDAAIASYQQAIALLPGRATARNDLGVALMARGSVPEAACAFGEAIRMQPEYADAQYNLGVALQMQGKISQSIAAYRRSIQLRPDCAEAHNNMGNLLARTGHIDEAIDSYRKAIRIRLDFVESHSNLVFTCHYHPEFDGKMIGQELRHWNLHHAEPLKKFIRPHVNDRDPSRRLRVGYVSPDFRANVVGQHLLPLLREHNREQVEIFCYVNSLASDSTTLQIHEQANQWRSIVELSDSDTADLIRRDSIDILVDLALHTSGNRLRVFAYKPAPVQVTYLAYCSSTGLDTMDYRLTDPYLDPPGTDDGYYSEKSVWLPETYWCYPPRPESTDVAALPLTSAGVVTFGCLNNFAKVSAPALELFADVMNAVERSRLILHCFPGPHLDEIRERFACRGIAFDRVEFAGEMRWVEYSQLYNRIDIALDPFPWAGGITTCDALWMGAPVVTLAGQIAVGRGGVSILSNIGLSELVATTRQQYVCIASALASDPARLAELRRTLRARMQRSPLMDAPRFARNVEVAYRKMWKDWCTQTAHRQ